MAREPYLTEQALNNLKRAMTRAMEQNDNETSNGENPYLVGSDVNTRLFNLEIGANKYKFLYNESWLIKKIDKFPVTDFVDKSIDIITDYSPRYWNRVFRYRGATIYLRVAQEKISINVASNLGSDQKEHEEVLDIVNDFKKLFPAAVATSDDECIFYFWHKARYGADISKKSLKIVSWQQIEKNYVVPASKKLPQLMKQTPLNDSPRLILWHGLAGSGKTFGIRALAHQWRNWCQFEYIMDPEVMLNDAAYMTDIIQGREIEDSYLDEDEKDDMIPFPKQKWRLVIMEDTGEVLSMDARERSGQGLSRLLNLADGLLGQGTRILFLITTNEELGKIHEAVKRPGRCLSQIAFSEFSPPEAKEWLVGNKIDFNSKLLDRRGLSLAELYAIANGETLETPITAKAGF